MRARLIAPAGVPATASQILAATATMMRKRSPDSLAFVRDAFGFRYGFGLSSGRAALYVILKALHRLRPERNVVAVPAYTCFSVPAAVVRAGLKIYPVDIDAATFDLNPQQLQRIPSNNLLCIVTSNLFGIVNDISKTANIARQKKAFVVDDAAQAMETDSPHRSEKTIPDVRFYSLGRGKPMPAGEGGLIVTDCDTIGAAVGAELESIPVCSGPEDVKILFKVIATSIFLHPSLYWIPDSIPFLKLGVTEFDPGFPVTKLGRVSHSLLNSGLSSVPALNQARRQKARYLAGALKGSLQFCAPKLHAEQNPAYVRFPVVAIDNLTRNRSVMALRKSGIGATPFYPSAICDIPGIAPHMALPDFHCPGAEDVARRLFTLPTHGYVADGELRRMTQVLRRISNADLLRPQSSTPSPHAVSA